MPPAWGPGHMPSADPAAAPTPDAAPPGPTAPPPPLYATQLPSSTTLHYRVHYLGRAARARLQWQAADGQYQLLLETLAEGGEPLLSQQSQGLLDAHGLAPQRFVDRRRGRAARAANVQQAVARVSFSGSAMVYPAWPGLQDRLSWMVQLGAISAAATEAGQALSRVELFVVDGLGLADTWVFGRLADAMLDTPAGPQATQHWRRDPPHPDGLRAEAWLALAGSTAAHWPVRLRYTLLRTGATIEMWLAEPQAR